MNTSFSGREELLTEHVMAWNRRKILNLAEALSKRFVKVIRVSLYSVHNCNYNNI